MSSAGRYWCAHCGCAVLFFKPLIHDQAVLTELLDHGPARVGCQMLDVVPMWRWAEARLASIGFSSVIWIACDQSFDVSI